MSTDETLGGSRENDNRCRDVECPCNKQKVKKPRCWFGHDYHKSPVFTGVLICRKCRKQKEYNEFD